MLYYNDEHKQRYIDSLSRFYVLTAQKFFEQSADTEDKKGKDIALFDKAEWFEFLKDIDVITLNKVQKYYNFFAAYADYYFKFNKLDSNNHYKGITSDDLVGFSRSVVNESVYISREKMLTIIDDIPNAVDKFMLLALYEGVRGRNFSDIMLLKGEDIDKENNVFHLPSGKIAKVSPELVEIALSAYNQKAYASLQSPLSAPSTASFPVTLDENEYVFRVRNNRKTKTTSAQPVRIYKKFAMLKDYFENPDFNLTRIFNSGYAYGIRCIMEKYGKTRVRDIYDTSEFAELNERFGLSNYDASEAAFKVKEYLE